jgi:hypothetical protein
MNETKDDQSERQLVTCDNCGWGGSASQLKSRWPDITALIERLDPGGEVPAGECPACRSLAYNTDYSKLGLKYLRSRTKVCPFCGFCEIEGQDPELGQNCHQDMKCLNCGGTWVDRYTLTGVVFDNGECVDLLVLPIVDEGEILHI